MRVGSPAPDWARRFWDEAYREGDHRSCWEDSAAAAAERVAGLGLPDGVRVLDLGCGGGHELLALAERGVAAVGLDRSLAALAVARGRARRAGLTVRLCCGDVRALPLGAGSIGLALDRGCFHQLGRHARRRYGVALATLLAPGGRLILWGARYDDEEAGLVGLTAGVLEQALPPHRFRRLASNPVTLAAPTGDLPGLCVVLERAGCDSERPGHVKRVEVSGG